ncbi:MAG: hypothetical protein ACP5O3_00820 [Candidatus Micrarchaeia archaeon]
MKAQLSMEFMVSSAAYLALITAFLALEGGIAETIQGKTAGVTARMRAENACFFVDSFALNGKNTAMRLGAENLSAAGEHLLSVSFTAQGGVQASANASCLASIQGAQEMRVKQSEKDFS